MDTKPIDFNPPTDEAPVILLPVKASLFADRADRFIGLADDHSLSEWLVFLAHLSRAQQKALQNLPELPLPNGAALDQARQHGMPPLNTTAIERPAAWRSVLREIIDQLMPQAGEATRALMQALRDADDAHLDRLADELLSGEIDRAKSGELPFIAAALQVVWTSLASRLDATHLQKLDTPGVCPCCGSLPVASVVRLSPTVNNLRYLHCSLCNTEWNLARAVCTHCNGDKGLAYQQLEGEKARNPEAMRAETCDSCKSYLKIAYQDKDPRVDPVADDIATLALDLLVDEAGYSRSGPNLFLIGGAA